jgi:hypothetical protein
MSETIEIKPYISYADGVKREAFDSLPVHSQIMAKHVETAWEVLKQGAVRTILHEVREGMKEAGTGDFPDDDELFASVLADGSAPRSPASLYAEHGDLDTLINCVAMLDMVRGFRDLSLMDHNEALKRVFGVDVIHRIETVYGTEHGR